MLLGLGLPLWFPWVLRPLASKYGVHYAHYERVGYRWFALDGLTFTNQAAKFRADRMEGLVPTVWLWRCVVAKAGKPEPVLHVDHWQFESFPSGKKGAGFSARLKHFPIAGDDRFSHLLLVRKCFHTRQLLAGQEFQRRATSG